MLDGKVLPASRFCGLVDIGGQTWQRHLFQSHHKEESPAGVLKIFVPGSSIPCVMWVGCLLKGTAWRWRWYEKGPLLSSKKISINPI